MAPKKVLITGANGFVGTNLTDWLAQFPEYEVYAMVRPGAPINFLRELQSHPGPSGETQERFHFVEGTLTDPETLSQAVEGMDAIVHLAGNVSDWGPMDAFYSLNVEGTAALLSAAAAAHVSQMIFMSSLTVHGMHRFVEAGEDAPRLCRHFPYGETKIQAEDLVTAWGSDHPGRQAIVIRPAYIIYGPYDRNSFVQALSAILRGKFAMINGGRALVSYVYVRNLCEGIRKFLDRSGLSGSYNVLDGNMAWRGWLDRWTASAHTKPVRLSVPYFLLVPIVGLLEGIYRLFRVKVSPPLNFYRIGIMRHDKSFSRAKLDRDLGFQAPFSLDEGIQATLTFFQKVHK